MPDLSAPSQTNQEPVTPITDLYAVFCGEINPYNAQRFAANICLVSNANPKPRVHLLLHSYGGNVADGIFIYNLIKNIPVEIIVYNGALVASAGVLAFLGAKSRKTAINSIFTIHKSFISPQMATVKKLKVITESLLLDDERSGGILKEHLSKLPKDHWDQLEHHDVHLTGNDAVKFGLADEIADFSPPVGTNLFNAIL